MEKITKKIHSLKSLREFKYYTSSYPLKSKEVVKEEYRNNMVMRYTGNKKQNGN